MNIIELCREVFNVVFVTATLFLVILNVENSRSKEKEENKEKWRLSRTEKWYATIQLSVVIISSLLFAFVVVYGFINKKFLWLFLIVAIPGYLNQIASIFSSVGIMGAMVKADENEMLSFKEHVAVVLIASGVMILQTIDCFENIAIFVNRITSNIISDMMLLPLYIGTLFVYIFLTCSLSPILFLFGSRVIKTIMKHLHRKERIKRLEDFYISRIEESIKPSQRAISFLEKVDKKKTFIKILCIPVVICLFVIDVGSVFINIVWFCLVSTTGYVVIVYRMIFKMIKKILESIVGFADKRMVAVSFRIAIIAALVITVITNRYEALVKNVEDSTAVLEFVASSVIIPVVFEWINSRKKARQDRCSSEEIICK